MHFLSTRRPLIEPLEQRIAPALLVNGANLLGGSGNPTTGQTSIGNNEVTLVKVLSGDAIVWYNHGAIDAISVGPNTALDITGDVGVIIGNLTAAGTLSNSSLTTANGLNGDVLLPNNILGITTHPLSGQLGSIGAIITGGSISNLNIAGDLGNYNFAGNGYEGGVYAGDGVFRAGSHLLSSGHVVVHVSDQFNPTGVDVNPIAPGIQDTFTFTAATAQVLSGASITGVKMGDAVEMQMFAGDGFAGTAGSPGHPGTAGQPGGSITNITVENAFITQFVGSTTPSYNFLAGNGGAGVKGGAGGGVSNVIETNSTGIVDLTGGVGGAGTGGAGGAGGSVKNLNMESVSSAYTIQAGTGGAGAPGGKGGSVTSVNFGGNQLSNGIVVAAPFTGHADQDILLIDSLSGNMVIEQNNGSGTGFTPVVQDNQVNLTTIAPDGTTPVAATVFYLNGNALPNIAVAYKNSESLGIYLNQGGGIFYQQNFSSGVYVGDTLEATAVSLPYAPEQIAAGNFTGDGSTDLAVTANNAGQTELITLAGNGAGAFTLATGQVPLPNPNPVSLLTADIQGGPYQDLFVGFQSGLISALLSTGSASGAAFNVISTGITVGGGILNLDYNAQEGLLLALNGEGNAMTFYNSDSAGTLIQLASVSLTQQPGTALVAHFVPETQSIAEPVQVLSSVGSGSRIDTYTQESTTFALTSSTSSTEALKNFVPVIENTTSGVAAVGGSVEHFAFSQNGAPFFDTSLPFSGKKVSLIAGDGGDGVNVVTNIAAGGAGGEIFGMNVLAGDITVQAGSGGNSINAAAGAGGLVADTPTLLTLAGQTVPTILEADFVLTIAGGTGGSASGNSHFATGGAGGAVDALSVSLLDGTTLISSGDGGSGGGGAGGAGGIVLGLKSVNNGGDLDVTAGNGGNALGAIGNGGAGGSIINLTHNLSLADQLTEQAYNVNLFAGIGGSSDSAVGGAGGSIQSVNLTLQPANESVNNPDASTVTTHTDTDSTLRVNITAGDGGAGAVGGAGGALKSISATAVYDQIVVIVAPVTSDNTIFPEVNPVAAQLTGGSGGAGSKGTGGAGGSITTVNLAGISHFDTDSADPQQGQTPLVITAGSGGSGATTGGAGGAVTGVTAINAPFDVTSGITGAPTGNDNLDTTMLSGATVSSGSGGTGGTGNGGAGGNISGLNIGVKGFIQGTPVIDAYLLTSGTQDITGGNLLVQSGSGGNGGTSGKGGAGGGIAASTLGSVDTFQAFAVMVQSGPGGAGSLAGGAGGNVSGLQLSLPQNPNDVIDGFDALSGLILAGNGGAGTGSKAAGGIGGSITQISELKDVNSAINLIQAGNGGAGVTAGGLGGSVSQVKTVGLIGQASDDFGNVFGVFQNQVDSAFFGSLFPAGVPQGVFSGRGGTGTTAGLDGSVTSINAYAIAAIGASANASGIFAAAEKVANITAQYVGYSAESSTTYQGSSPGLATPTDGFIFSVTKPTGVTGTVLTGSEFF
jgi:hypothetical protein